MRLSNLQEQVDELSREIANLRHQIERHYVDIVNERPVIQGQIYCVCPMPQVMRNEETGIMECLLCCKEIYRTKKLR